MESTLSKAIPMSCLQCHEACIYLIRIALTSIAACTVFTPPVAASGQTPDDYVLVRRIIDTRYFKADSFIPQPEKVTTQDNATNWTNEELRPSLNLKDVLQSNIAREITVSKDEAISKVVLREYGFGQRNSPRAYSAVEGKILELNNLSAPENLQTGATIKIPALPRIALREPNISNASNLIPKSSVYPNLSKVASFEAFNPQTYAFTEKPILSEAGREGSPLVMQYLWLPSDYKEVSGSSDIGFPYEEVQSQSISVNMGSIDTADSAPAIPFPSFEDSKIIKAQFSEPPKLQPVLIILDDGWPNDEAFAHSSNFIAGALETIKRKFNYPVYLDSSFVQSTQSTDYPKAVFHALSIDKALASLAALEPRKEWKEQRVKIVYIPLSTAQKNSKRILEELVTLRLIDDFMLDARGDSVPPDDVKKLRAIAKDIVDRLKQDIGVTNLNTDKAIIESVLVFADLYSVASGNPYVVNFSWTTAKRKHKFTNFDFNQGILVSAAGNSSSSDCKSCRPYLAYGQECACADNVAAEERWFAVRAVTSQDVVAVMNTARDGSLQCRSSIIGSRQVDPLAISFDGYVSKEICGTSFAAPRVAWLLAAKLAYIPPQGLSNLDAPDKGHRLREIIRGARQGGNDSGGRYNLDIKKLFTN